MISLQGRVIYLAASLVYLFVGSPAKPSYAEVLAGDVTPPAEAACGIDCQRRKLLLPPRNAENRVSLVLGTSIYMPELAGHTAAPIGAIYLRHRFDDLRMRGVFSIFENELEVSKTRERFQLLGELDNRTYPFTTTETVDGREAEGTAIKWGTVNGRLGAGWWSPVHPFQIENDLRVQLYYQLGYLYSERVPETGRNVTLPPDTIQHGPLVRMRFDDLHRNVLDLPEDGAAVGADLQYLARARWSGFSDGSAPFTKSQTRDFVKVSGYFIVATDLPYLSNKNRLLAALHGGFTPYGFLDRYSAFRIGGGPVINDPDDLGRSVYPGAMFNQFAVYDYVMTSLEYRREILPSLYFHLRGGFANISRELFVVTGHGHYRTEPSYGFSTALTGALLGNTLRAEYTYDTRAVRNGTSGSSLVLLWSRSFGT